MPRFLGWALSRPHGCLDWWVCVQEHEGRLCARCPVACPRGCGASVARGELAEHAASVCPREPVACAVGGCGAVVARGDMAAHVGGGAPAIALHVGALAAVCGCACARADGGPLWRD